MRLALSAHCRIYLLATVVFLASLLAASIMAESHKAGSGEAHSYEVADLMEKLDADFGALVKAALITSVQELVNDPPYATIAKHAESMVATAKVLPSVEEFQGDNSMLALSRRLEGAAAALARAAKSKDIAATAKALFEVHGACVRCHEEARF